MVSLPSSIKTPYFIFSSSVVASSFIFDTIYFRLNSAVPLSLDFYCFSWYFHPMRFTKSKVAMIFGIFFWFNKSDSLNCQFFKVSTCTALDKLGGLV